MRKTMLAVVGCSLVLSGCATGRINSGYRWPSEAAAPATTGSNSIGQVVGDLPIRGAKGAPLRQMQVNLVVILASLLTQDGFTITQNAQVLPSNTLKTDGPRTIDLTGLNNRESLDKLLGAVGSTTNPARVRNEVVGQMVAASNANCNVYLQALRSGQVEGRLLSDLFASGLGVAGGLARSARTASRMSSLAGFSVAVGASVDRNIFAQQGAELVADSIVKLRTDSRATLEARMKLDYQTWPMGLALADVFNYHGDCSMLRGFSSMRQAIEGREQTIVALRKAAAAVAKADGSGYQVAAVLAGADPEPQPAPAALIGRADIDRNRMIGEGCLKTLADAFKDDKTKQTFDKATDLKACKAGQSWAQPFVTLAGDTWEKTATAARLKQAQDARTRTEKPSDDDLTALIAEIQADYVKAASDLAGEQSSARGAAALALEQINSDQQDAAAVVSLLTTLAAATPSDPVMIAGLGAANAAKAAGTVTGPSTAQWALGAMRGAYADAIQ